MTNTPIDPDTEALLKEIFEMYDTDKSGKLDAKEMAFMMETLGLSASMAAILKMIRDVDTDGNDEIDFDELKQIVAANSGATTKGANGISFAAVFERKKIGGPPMGWRGDKVSSSMTVSATHAKGEAGEGKWGCALTSFVGTDPVEGAWISTSSYTDATVLLEIESLGGDGYMAVATKNFFAKDASAGDWDMELGLSKEQPGMAPFAGVKLSTGQVYLKGKALEMKMGAFQEGDRVSFDINAHNQSMTIKCLKVIKTKGVVDDPPQWDDSNAVEISGLPPEVAVALCLGNHPDGKSSTVRFVGSSCCKTPKVTAAQADGTDSAKSGDAKVDPMIAQAQSMAM